MPIPITASTPLGWFRQHGLFTLSASELRGENLDTGAQTSIAREAAHPRTLIARFEPLQAALAALRRELFPRGWTRPQVVLCLVGQAEGGYTEIETKALREAALGAGVRKLWITPRPLVASEARAFFRSGVAPTGGFL